MSLSEDACGKCHVTLEICTLTGQVNVMLKIFTGFLFHLWCRHDNCSIDITAADHSCKFQYPNSQFVFFQLITSVKLISGSVPINDVSQKPGNVIEKMTVVTTRMKIVFTVPVEPVPQANLNVTMAAASHSPGSVMWMMIVVITLMSHSTNAVSTQL